MEAGLEPHLLERGRGDGAGAVLGRDAARRVRLAEGRREGEGFGFGLGTHGRRDGARCEGVHGRPLAGDCLLEVLGFARSALLLVPTLYLLLRRLSFWLSCSHVIR